MTIPPRVYINCRHHEGQTIARIVENGGVTYVKVRNLNPVRSLGGHFPMDEGSMPLDGPYAERRWKGMSTVDTWCRRCGGPHDLPLTWLREIATIPGVNVCPCERRARPDGRGVLGSDRSRAKGDSPAK